jgi:hypothetical protein
MNVQPKRTIAMQTLHVEIMVVRLIVHVILATQEVELLAKVGSEY